ncbi:DUF5696 domain-containing protein [Paenibacillus sp. 598K]|uniref:DUF5696 domain-containing protein n=1 Tax=Paenibacillus sp. 598K TaxID=1117987 RepID=UPI000FFF2338|nr:DUF5696 domain-containing protein [Paenibacillus sp. 598K]
MKQLLKTRVACLLLAGVVGCLTLGQSATLVQSQEAAQSPDASAASEQPVQESAEGVEAGESEQEGERGQDQGLVQEGRAAEGADGGEPQMAQPEQAQEQALAPGQEQAQEPSGQTAATGEGDRADAVESATDNLEGMEAMADNGQLTLYVHPETTQVAVLHQRSGDVWHTNPPDREADAIATGYNKAKLNVQFELTYYDESGNALRYDNYTHSILSGQFEIEPAEDGVTIVYTIGEVAGDLDAIPKYINASRFQSAILDRLSSDADRREVSLRFRLDEEQQRYERRDSALRGVGLSKLLGLFEEIGYDEAERAIDKEAYGESAEGPQGVRVPLAYQIEDDELRVSISGEGLQYPASMHIQSISLLPFFGASGQEDEGYIVVPDGSGSLIRFNNGRTYAAPYRTLLYGGDGAISQLANRQQAMEARLPVFGMSYGDRGFMGIIESGDAVAAVEADVSGRLNAYNNVYPTFTIYNYEEVTLSNGWRSSTIKRFQQEPFRGDIAVRYQFLEEDRNGYPDMAASYRDYLVRTTGMAPLEDDTGVPFYVELIGGIPKQKFFLGIPYQAYEPLTTFEQAAEILGQMQDAGIDNIKLRYTGWFNNGIHHNTPSGIKVDRKLGGSKGLRELQAVAEAADVALYPDASFQEAAPRARGFSRSSQASRFISNKVAAVYPYATATYGQDLDADPGYIVSPKALPSIVDGFIADYRRTGLTGLSLRDFGSELNGDYNRAGVIDREAAKGIVREQLARLGEAAEELLIEGGNAYAAPYARHIVDAPMTSSGFNITDESIPLFQLVYHGYVSYAGTPWNLADNQDARINFLQALESGAGLHYTWFHAEASAIKMTGFDHYYSADYRSWLDEAARQYRELDEAIGDVSGQPIVDHRRVAEGVYKTTYDGGKTVVVNYNDAAVEVDGVRIDAMDYGIGGGKR